MREGRGDEDADGGGPTGWSLKGLSIHVERFGLFSCRGINTFQGRQEPHGLLKSIDEGASSRYPARILVDREVQAGIR